MEPKKVFQFRAGGHDHTVELEPLFNPPGGVADLEYHRFLSYHYATVSELRGIARSDWECAKVATEAEFNRLYHWYTIHFEEQAKRPTREFLRACVETQESWKKLKDAEMAAERNFRDAESICNSLWFHSRLVMAVTAGVSDVITAEIERRGGQ